MKPFTMVPDRTSIRVELFFMIFGIATDMVTASRPTPKAEICRKKMEPPRMMERAAPTLAPEETPRMSGETSGLRKTL